MQPKDLLCTLRRITFALAVTGAMLFQTTGCDLNSFLATYGLTALLSSLSSSSTSG